MSCCMLVVLGVYNCIPMAPSTLSPYSISCESANVRLQIVCGLCNARLIQSYVFVHSHTCTPFDTNECILSIIKCNPKPNGRVLICMLSLMVRIISVSVAERRVRTSAPTYCQYDAVNCTWRTHSKRNPNIQNYRFWIIIRMRSQWWNGQNKDFSELWWIEKILDKREEQWNRTVLFESWR